MIITKEQNEILQKARDTYGSRNQLAVAAEELNELAIALLKFMRYSDEIKGIDETFDKVLEERADVEVILNHIDNIYGFTEKQIQAEVWGKVERLRNWLNKTSDMEYTMEERKVPRCATKDCRECYYFDHPEEAFESGICKSCKS